MTEQDWLAATEPTPMIQHLGAAFGDREHRLFACASARRMWKHLDEHGQAAVEVAERFADGLASAYTLELAFRAADSTWAGISDYVGSRRAMRRREKGREAIKKAAWMARNAANPDLNRGQLRFYAHSARAKFAQAEILRDLFGPLPFRAVAIDPAWLSSNDDAARGLAATVDEEGTFDLLPVLGDALEDAGCADPTILDHLRGPGPHVRGCWAMDRITGKR